MSCNYADGLSPYENKGVLGKAEKFDSEELVNEKCKKLVKMILASKHTVIHTGAGISTSAGIPDFRGPNGVWTLEKKGEKPSINVSFTDATPTKTHLALKSLIDAGHVHYIISQNIDGLHLKSGLQRKNLAELHGNMFIEHCNKCKREYVRNMPVPTVGQKNLGIVCRGGQKARPCRGGYLMDNILDWEHDLPDRDADMAMMHSTIADLNICLGTTLQIVPSGNFPLKNQKFGGKLIICNLQPTKHDKKADLIINTYVDDVLTKVAALLDVEVQDYNKSKDPTKKNNYELEWTIPSEIMSDLEKHYNQKLKEHRELKKRKISSDDWKTVKDEKVANVKSETDLEIDKR